MSYGGKLLETGYKRISSYQNNCHETKMRKEGLVENHIVCTDVDSLFQINLLVNSVDRRRLHGFLYMIRILPNAFDSKLITWESNSSHDECDVFIYMPNGFVRMRHKRNHFKCTEVSAVRLA